MSKSSSRARGCFKVGCFGCLGVLLLTIGVPLLLGGIGMMMGGTPEPERFQEELRRDVSPQPPGGSADAVDAGDGTATGEATDGQAGDGETGAGETGAGEAGVGEASATVGDGALSLDEFADARAREGRLGGTAAPTQSGILVLDITMAQLEVVAGPPDEGFRLVADYDRAGYRLEETLETAEDGTWTYRVGFESKIPFFRRFFSGANRVENELKLVVPRGLPLRVEGDIGIGESNIDLGGLSLSAVNLEYGPGDHTLEFSEPVPTPVTKIQVDGSVGEVTVAGVGNASPERVIIDSGVGELLVDLSGAWRNDADINVRLGVGECDVRVPEGVAVDIDQASVSVGERIVRDLEAEEMLPEGAPTLRFEVESGVGELSIRRR